MRRDALTCPNKEAWAGPCDHQWAMRGSVQLRVIFGWACGLSFLHLLFTADDHELGWRPFG